MDTLLKENLTGENHEEKNSNSPLRYLTASSLLADSVYNRQNEKLGEIKDIMFDLSTGKIEYLVIEYGGFLGIGEKFYAVPFRLLEVDPAKQVLLLDQRKDVLKNAPGFDKDHWPNTNTHEMHEQYSYWAGFMGPNTGNL